MFAELFLKKIKMFFGGGLVAREKLKRELEQEALARLEDAARTADDFDAIINWWDRLDANRERRERDHETRRSEPLLEWGADPDAAIVPAPYGHAFWRQLKLGDFIEYIFDCPYELHELVEDTDISALLKNLSENHAEILYYSAVRLYTTEQIGTIRGQTDRNIRKVRATLIRSLHKYLLPKLIDREKKGLPLTTEQRRFLNASIEKSGLDSNKDG